MAKNRLFERGQQFPATPTVPADPSSGDAVLIGVLPAVALIDADADGRCTVQSDGIWLFDVAGAVANGAPVYIDADGDLSGDAGGSFFGTALAPVADGATATIPVAVGQGYPPAA